MFETAMSRFIALFFELSFVVYTSDTCLYWYYESQPEKPNPCGDDCKFVPDNAERIDEYESE